MRRSIEVVLASVVLVVACSDGRGGGSDGGSGISVGSQDEGGLTAASGATGGSDGGQTGADSQSGDDMTVFDLGAMLDAEQGDCVDGVGEDCAGCTAVDLLFIVDNSLSMEDEQIALTQAFPDFADTILDALPDSVNVHIGVTSTEMGYSNEGGFDAMNFCIGTGVGGAPAANWYHTPDAMPTATNGAQGRLYEAGGVRYFDIDTDAPPADVQALKDWFAQAAHIGEGGSNVEMAMAAATWALDPVNDATNNGFVRDEGAVLAFFFVQDEPDQTPTTATAELLDKVVAAKQLCGGWDCTVGGGFVNEFCLSQVPLGDLLNNLSEPPVTATFPMAGVQPADFEPVLRDTLAQAIVDKCGEIEPPG